MITSKYINKIIAVLVLITIIFTILIMFDPQILNFSSTSATSTSTSTEYESKLFNKDAIVSIDIKADEDEFNEMIENAKSEEYISCDVTINGTTFYSVGLRPKGNSSLSMIAGDDDSDRFSFKFEFDHYIEDQTCFGLNKFVVNNVQADATYMKEYLSYELMKDMGVPTPLYAYTNVMVNGEPWGFYLAVESLEESFTERNFGSDVGFLYKPESMNMGGAPQNAAAPNIQTDTANEKVATQTPHRQNENKSEGGSALQYIDDAISSYPDLFDYAVFKSTDADQQRVIEALKNLSTSTDLEKYINVDEVLRYFAVNTVVVNLDSYVSNMKHNYYLYEQDSQLSILPWDFNLAFAGFQAGSSTSAVNFPIDTPLSGIELSERPLLAKLLEVDAYKDKYHDYLSEIVAGPLKTSISTIGEIDLLIKDYVKNDVSAFYTYDEYLAAVPALEKFIELRMRSISGQLDGTIPSTTDGQSESPNTLIDASGINLKTLGTQGGGEGGAPGAPQDGLSPGKEKDGNIIPAGDSPPDMPRNDAMLGREIMSQAMQILGNATATDLTSAQTEELKALGLTSEQIESLKNRSQKNGSTGDVANPPATSQNILLVAICTASITISLIFVIIFKRKRYSKL